MKQVLILCIVTLIGVSLLPVEQAETPPFANPAFQRLWSVQSAAAAGSFDLWGSEPLVWRIEPYLDSPDGRRIVQYFDRGRMELTPEGPSASRLIVTQGLLALEMTTGRIQLGNRLNERRPPAQIPIDGGPADDRVPTYAALSNVVGSRAVNRVGRGELPSQWIDASGTPRDGAPVTPLRSEDYIAESGHNLPGIVVDFFARRPFGTATWIEAMGYPESEPYWTTYRRNGSPLPSLIQVFERRILVYTPSLPKDEQFTVTSIGRHYYRWRYGVESPRQWPDPKSGTPNTRIVVPRGFEAGTFADEIGTPVGLALGVDGRIWILTQEGEVLRVDSEHSDGSADHITVFARGLANPRGLAISGDAVYVSVDDGIVELVDRDGDGAADRQSYLTRELEPASGTRGAPTLASNGDVLVAGTRVRDGQERVIAQVAGDGRPAVSTRFSYPGPVLVKHGRVVVVDRVSDERTQIVQMPLAQLSLENPSGPAPASEDPPVTFGDGAAVNAVILFDSGLWPQVPPDTLFAAVSRGDSGSVVRAMPRDDGSAPELVDFATGFSRPVAMAVGLDGSLYVADAGRGEVIKIIAEPRDQ